jgi:ParB-like chromosome segregation protein Spo0J
LNVVARGLPPTDWVAVVDMRSFIQSLPRHETPISELLAACSPRAKGENPAYISLLANADRELEPILAHRSTMRVIDGMHRLRAAEARGATHIPVRYYDGSDDDAFVVSVRLNVNHGLPLTSDERKRAASRIIDAYPHWSDRTIARCAGLSAKTVGALRRRATEEIPQLETRLGRDGKMRPVSYLEGRRRVVVQLAETPEASLRELAERAGVSVNTVRDVRDRLRRGESPFPDGRHNASMSRDGGRTLPPEPPAPARVTRSVVAIRRRTPPRDRKDVLRSEGALRKLARDPSVRGSESGRHLLRMLIATELDRDQWRAIVENVPAHAIPWVRALAAQRLEEWKWLMEMRLPIDSWSRRAR